MGRQARVPGCSRTCPQAGSSWACPPPSPPPTPTTEPCALEANLKYIGCSTEYHAHASLGSGWMEAGVSIYSHKALSPGWREVSRRN